MTRKPLFAGITAVLVILAMETIGWVGLRLSPGNGSAIDGSEPQLFDGDAVEPQVQLLQHEALHPFLGFVQDPAVTEIRTPRGRLVDRPVTTHGFIETPPSARVEGEGQPLLVAVIGGSMAHMMVQSAGHELATLLAGEPRWLGRPVVIESLAMGGYKQPQQLLAVSYFLALGWRPDVVINLDGYNDVVLGFTENLREGVFPFYPRGWRWRVEEVPDPEVQAAIGRVAFLRDRRQELGQAFAGSLLRHSQLGRFFWLFRDRRYEASVVAAEVELREWAASSSAKTFRSHGPPFDGDIDEYLHQAVGVWSRSSRQLDAFCRGLGIDYYHFLQPNQYDPGAKPMGSAERARALRSESHYTSARLVREGYPALSEAGGALRQQGIRFHDLRALFATVEEPLYVDMCCHVGAEGSRLLAGAIARAIREEPEPGHRGQL